MTITKLQDKYLAEIDKLRTILDDENIEKLELIMQMKKAEGKISDYMNEINNIKNLQQFLENMTSSTENIQELLLKLEKHIR